MDTGCGVLYIYKSAIGGQEGGGREDAQAGKGVGVGWISGVMCI